MPSRGFAIHQTYSGSTVIRVFDDNPKVTRPQMPLSFVANNQSWMANSFEQFPSTGGRKDFRFYSVRATKLGNPIAITIEPNADGSNPIFPFPQVTNPGAQPLGYQDTNQGPLPLGYTNNGYVPFPPTSPRTPMEIYAPRAFSHNDRYLMDSKSGYLNGDDDADDDKSSSTSSSSEDDHKMFHYLEFAIVSMFFNPLFGLVAVILSLSSKYKAKKQLYSEAKMESRFAFFTAALGIIVTILVIVLAVVYWRMANDCEGC